MQKDHSIITVDSGRPGPTITVMSGVHGDEKDGILAMTRILAMISSKELIIKAGKVNFIYANLKAIAKGIRQTEFNFNRIFRPENLLTTAELNSWERRRAETLMPYLDESLALLDLHSSNNQQSTPFVICEPHSFEVAAKLPTPIVSHGWDIIEAGGTDYYMNRVQTNSGKGYGICFEAGYHGDPESPDRGIQACLIFLAHFCQAEKKEMPEPNQEPQRIIHAYDIYKTITDFKLERPFADFEAITKGTLIGHDGGQEIRAEKDCIIIFPQKECKGTDEEAFILGLEQ